MPDPKWLEILKASGWQTSAIAVACALMLIIGRQKLVFLEPWMVTVLVALLALSACLAVASVVKASVENQPIRRWLLQQYERRRSRRAVTEYIPFMTEDDREIIAYLLAKKQKMFTCARDGGNATTLIARGIVVHAMKHGHQYDMENIPMMVPDHIWEVLEQHSDKFPYRDEADAGHPWRVSWMLR